MTGLSHFSLIPHPPRSSGPNPIHSSVIPRRHLLLQIPHQRHPQLRPVVPPQRVAHDLSLDARLDHLERAADDALEDLDVREAALDGLVGELDEVGEGVVVEGE